MKINTLFIVTFPSEESDLGDIMFEADMRMLANVFRGGLDSSDIAAVFTSEAEAESLAVALLNLRG